MQLTVNTLVMIYWLKHIFFAITPPAPLPDSSLFLFPQSPASLSTLPTTAFTNDVPLIVRHVLLCHLFPLLPTPL